MHEAKDDSGEQGQVNVHEKHQVEGDQELDSRGQHIYNHVHLPN